MLSSTFYKYISLMVFFAEFSVSGNKVKNETSSMEIINAYAEKVNEKLDRCSKVNLTVTFLSNFQMKTVSVLISLSDSKFKDCFTYFKINLNNRKVAHSSMVSFNYHINKIVSHAFQNVGCGIYELNILPCYNNWQCQQPPFRVQNINMTSTDCLGIYPEHLRHKVHSQDFEKKVLSIVGVVAVSLLIIIGVSCYKIAILESKKEKKLYIEDGITSGNHELAVKRIQVFIINHYNNTTIRKVELLKDFLLHCPNLDVILIEDGLAISLATGSEWLESMLCKADEDDVVVKKIIIVDSIEKMEDLQNENENNTFYEAIKKISCDWLRSLDDYDNLFVVHFNSSFSKLKELDYIVTRVRYCIPNRLIPLCLNLMFGTQYDAHEMEERLKNVLSNHNIRNLGFQMKGHADAPAVCSARHSSSDR